MIEKSRLNWGFLLVALLVIFAGCSSPNSKDSASFDLSTGRHTGTWNLPDSHGASAKAQSNGFAICQECHATDFSGGISAISCFSCHGVNAPHARAPWRGGTYTHTNTNQGNAPICAQCHANGANSSMVPVTPAPAGTTPGCFNNTLCHAVPGHPAGWDAPTQHGASAKASNGFSTCTSCHAADFTGGIANTACSSCHNVNAPHPPKPWRDATTYTHTTTNENNAAVCAQCHTNGANSALVPVTPAPAGTAPGCFNNTLCHAQAGHPAGWNAANQHGVAAKAANGFSGCESCHGTDFTGGLSQVACSSCHGVSAPHPATPWRGGAYTHTTTNELNAPVCAQCHQSNAGTPGCFNNTLCHATPGHAVGWSNPTSHGPAAKTGTGFSSCQSCHATNFSGGTSGIACSSCHGVSAPHPAAPWRGGANTHTTTDVLNAPVCAQCHQSNAGTPGCFNNTLCHSNTGTCVSCHGSSQNGRRIVTGASGDFVRTTHHVTNGTTNEIVNDAACAVCHGNLQTDLNHPSGTLPAIPNVQLMDPDSAGTYVANTPAGIELACSRCHDANGATRLGSPAQPFSAAAGDTGSPVNIGWTATQQAHSVTGGNGGCLACHGNAGTANAHGSSQPMMMKYTYNSATTVATATNVCYNCHGTTAANGAVNNVGADFAKTYGHKTVTCFVCHEQHQAKAGNHTAGSTALAGVLNGATGKGVTTWSGTTWGGVTTYAATGTATTEWQVCFKCHSGASLPTGTGAAAYTDLGLEFSPNNASGHPIVAGLNNYTNSTAPKALTAAKMKAPWNVNLGTQTMTCSDCHATDSTASKGPHGSAVKWMLAGTNKAWPYTSAASNGASTGTLFRMSTYNTGNNTANGLFCLNCHTVTGTNNWHSNGDVTGGQHGGNNIMACASCHLRIPHGGKISRLLQTTNTPARYKATGAGSAVSATIDSWGGSVGIKGSGVSTSGNPNFNTSCSTHNGATGEAW